MKILLEVSENGIIHVSTDTPGAELIIVDIDGGPAVDRHPDLPVVPDIEYAIGQAVAEHQPSDEDEPEGVEG